VGWPISGAARLQDPDRGARHQKAISRIETGDRIVADYELQYLADALETSILNLLGIE